MKRSIIPAPPAELVIVRSEQVPKLSKRADGNISYQIGHLPDKSELYFALTGNNGGGYFSREWLPLSRVIDKLTELAKTSPFPAIALKSVFVGKSVNNASFLAAALVAEEVLKTDPEKAFRLRPGLDPAQWQSSLFDLTGELVHFQPENAVEPSGEIKKNKRGAKPKGVIDVSDPASE